MVEVGLSQTLVDRHRTVNRWSNLSPVIYAIVRSLSIVGHTSVASVIHSIDSGLTNLIHDRCSCTLFTLLSVDTSACSYHTDTGTGLFTLCWMCPLKCEQARREWESELRLVNSL